MRVFIRTADAIRSLILVSFLRGMSRRAKQTGKPLKQQTLTSFLPSSPQRGPPSPTNSKSRKLPISSQRTASARKPVPVPVDNNEDSDGDTSDVDAIQFEPDVIELSDEDASPRRPTTQRRGVPATQARGLKLDDDSGDLFSTRSDSSISESRKKVRLGKRKQVVELSESEEEAVQPRRRKLIKGTRPPSVDSDGEDLMEEVEEHRKPGSHLLKSLFRPNVGRYITKAHAHSRQKDSISKELGKTQKCVYASAILRFPAKPSSIIGKKLGLAAQSSSEDSANEEEEEEESPLRSSSVVPFAGAKPHTSDGEEGSEDESQDEDTFIVEDDAAAAELPPEFSMDTHQDLAHQFKIICQFFVHLAVQKPKDRHSYMEHTMKSELVGTLRLLGLICGYVDTKYFSVPLQIARRKLSGLKDSLVASSVWRPDFKNQLQRYPTFELTSLSFAIPACDACHLGGRMSTLLGRVGGNPYDRMGFKVSTAFGHSCIFNHRCSLWMTFLQVSRRATTIKSAPRKNFISAASVQSALESFIASPTGRYAMLHVIRTALINFHASMHSSRASNGKSTNSVKVTVVAVSFELHLPRASNRRKT